GPVARRDIPEIAAPALQVEAVQERERSLPRHLSPWWAVRLPPESTSLSQRRHWLPLRMPAFSEGINPRVPPPSPETPGSKALRKRPLPCSDRASLPRCRSVFPDPTTSRSSQGRS